MIESSTCTKTIFKMIIIIVLFIISFIIIILLNNSKSIVSPQTPRPSGVQGGILVNNTNPVNGISGVLISKYYDHQNYCGQNFMNGNNTVTLKSIKPYFTFLYNKSNPINLILEVYETDESNIPIGNPLLQKSNIIQNEFTGYYEIDVQEFNVQLLPNKNYSIVFHSYPVSNDKDIIYLLYWISSQNPTSTISITKTNNIEWFVFYNYPLTVTIESK